MSSTSFSSRKRHDDRRQHHHRAKKSKKHRSKHVSSSEETETSEFDSEEESSSTSDEDDTRKAKLKKSSKKRRHHESKTKKRKTSKHDKKHKHKKRKKETQDQVNKSSGTSTFGPAIGSAVPSTSTVHATAAPGSRSTESSQKCSESSGRSMVPMTKEQYEKQQSIIRRVFDPETGRSRLVKGDGEIVEEIVSREQQKAINKRATLGDSLSFQAGLKKYM